MGCIERIAITEETRSKLRREKNRTGLGGRALLHGRRDQYPSGLTSTMIDAWRGGAIASAKPAHLKWVLKAYADWSPPPPADLPKRITLTNQHRLRLQNEEKRTGLGTVSILRHAPKPLPDGLNHQKVQRWISGNTKTANRAHWDFVMQLYESLGS